MLVVILKNKILFLFTFVFYSIQSFSMDFEAGFRCVALKRVIYKKFDGTSVHHRKRDRLLYKELQEYKRNYKPERVVVLGRRTIRSPKERRMLRMKAALKVYLPYDKDSPYMLYGKGLLKIVYPDGD